MVKQFMITEQLGPRDNSNWDLWFLDMAEFVATKSKDPSTKCGAVITRPDMPIAGLRNRRRS